MSACAVCGYEGVEAFKFCPECGAAAATGTLQQRKVVTVVFCDVVGSTALGESIDPEALRALLARYFERMKVIVERHGGRVEKFIGDAVMAVFGIPVAHEDDALRACRATLEMRETLPELEVEGRIGIATGEVVAGTEERLATGDAVNVAARLQQAAQPGEALVGEETRALVGAAVDVEVVEALALKGKAELVPAYRLLAVREAPERRPEARFVGRERELMAIQESWERALAQRRCELVTIVGEAGVGKSRLVAEALASLDAPVVQGRCLPYGEGITYWAVVEMLKQLDASPTDETAAAAIRSLLGETDAATSAEEIAWAVRKLLEEQAPLIAVFDDIQWGEETFLDLLEHVALLSSGAPILLLAMARPELTERRADWPVKLRLEPLGAAEAEELIPERISDELRAKIARAAGGNPLFVEEMVAMAGEAGGEVVVPPTLQALLAARLDQLDSAERSVLERGAVEGEVFHRGAVQALAPEESQVTPRLASLVRKGLIRPVKPQLAGEDGFRFHHLLIRDAAYASLPKATRADLHQRFAAWLERHGNALVELDEIIGHHLEQACSYRAELRLPEDAELIQAARKRLTDAGRRAKVRNDYGAAVNLLERAATLMPGAEIDLALETELTDALFWAGRAGEALRRAESIAERAAAAGDRVGELCGKIEAGIIRTFLEPEGAAEQLAALVGQVLPMFQTAGDHHGLYTAYHALGLVASQHQQWAAGLDAYERAAAHARQAGLLNEFTAWRAACRYYGTTTARDLLAWLDEREPPARREHWLGACRAGALAMLGRFEEARAILAETRSELAERGARMPLADVLGLSAVDLELWAGNPAAAAELGAEGCRLFEELGEQTMQGTAAANLAHALYALDRLDEADAWAGRAAELGASDDAHTQMLWRRARAKVLTRRGEHTEGERLAREAVAIGENGDSLNAQGDANADLAEVLLLTGKADEATAALEQALARYERKENIVMAERVRIRLAELQPSEAAERA